MPETTTPLTLTVNVTIAVDANGWTRDYGIEGADAIRNDVHSYLTTVLQACNENITLVEPFAMTVTPAERPEQGHEPLDALLDAAAEAGCSDIVLRPGESPLVIINSARVEIGHTEPLDYEVLATQTRSCASLSCRRTSSAPSPTTVPERITRSSPTVQ
jgi:hypothetical protein